MPTNLQAAKELARTKNTEAENGFLAFVRQSAKVVIPLGQVIELRRHFGDQLAVVAHFKLCQLAGVASNEVAQLSQQRAALTGRELGPRTAGKCLVCGGDRTIGIVGRALRDLTPDLAREWVVAVKPQSRTGIRKLPVDVHLVSLHLHVSDPMRVWQLR